MKKTTKNILIISSIIASATILFFVIKRSARWKTFWKKAIYGVLAHEGGQSEYGGSGKKFTDLFALDGGTVGICHFAAGGLCGLYEEMNTKKYFNKTSEEMCDKWAYKNSGAYNQSWWREGMAKFLNNPNNNRIQINACQKARQESVKNAIYNGWKTNRQLAIAVGVSNSFGNQGFLDKATNQNWDAEKLLNWYGNISAHKERRKNLINKWFPKNKERNIV